MKQLGNGSGSDAGSRGQKGKERPRIPEVHACIVCINAANSVSVNIDERTPLISSNSSGGSGNNNTHRPQYGSIHRRPRHNQFSWVLVTALFLFFFTGIGIATYLLFNEGVDFTPEIYKLVGRDEWNASSSTGPLGTISMPADSVIITDTPTDHCDRLPACARLIRRVQNESMTLHVQPDLKYNFLIDDVGTVYEGLGWYHTLSSGGRPIVAFIGSTEDITPTNDQIIALKILLKFAVDRHVLTSCYVLKVEGEEGAGEVEGNSSLVALAAMLQIEVYNECI